LNHPLWIVFVDTLQQTHLNLYTYTPAYTYTHAYLRVCGHMYGYTRIYIHARVSKCIRVLVYTPLTPVQHGVA